MRPDPHPVVRSTQAVRIRVFSELRSEHEAFDVTDERAMAALRDAEERHFWHRARNELISERLRALGLPAGARFVELGCGGGCVSAHLSSAGMDVVGVEGHRGLVQRAAARAPRATFWVHDLSQGVEALPPQPFEAAGLFDVLEHLDTPLQALEDARRMVVEGGWIVGTVPAMMQLWSRADEQAGHRTRYDQGRLRALLASVQGCRVVEVVPFNRLLVPLLWVRRYAVARRSGVAEVSEANFRVPTLPINAAMSWLLRAERALSGALPLDTVDGASLWFAIQRVQ